MVSSISIECKYFGNNYIVKSNYYYLIIIIYLRTVYGFN